MGFREGLKKIWGKTNSYWLVNLDTEHKTLSISFGAMLITIITALALQLTAMAVGATVDWGIFLVAVITAGSMFSTILIQSVFGKNKNNKTNGDTI